MKLIDFINRNSPPEPWAEGDNIPWDEPGFSERMLKEHLDPEHDAASRRPSLITEQVTWLHNEILADKGTEPLRILDLGCGPGLYAVRLAKLGHEVTGIDISPASLEYARKLADENGVKCEFLQADFWVAELDGTYDLVVQIFGELNVFRRAHAAAIVRKYTSMLAPNGRMVLEVDRPETTRERGNSTPGWRSRESGLFSNKPHLYLEESFWNDEQRIATTRYWVIDGHTAEVTRYAQSFASYEPDEYRAMLTSAGLTDVELISEYPEESTFGDLQRWMLVGRKQS